MPRQCSALRPRQVGLSDQRSTADQPGKTIEELVALSFGESNLLRSDTVKVVSNPAQMRLDKLFQNVLIAGSAVLTFGAATPSLHAAPVVTAKAPAPKAASAKESPVASLTKAALAAFESAVRPLSSTRALEDAFRAYFTFKAERPQDVKKPLLYFVDYGLPSTTARGCPRRSSTNGRCRARGRWRSRSSAGSTR